MKFDFFKTYDDDFCVHLVWNIKFCIKVEKREEICRDCLFWDICTVSNSYLDTTLKTSDFLTLVKEELDIP